MTTWPRRPRPPAVSRVVSFTLLECDCLTLNDPGPLPPGDFLRGVEEHRTDGAQRIEQPGTLGRGTQESERDVQHGLRAQLLGVERRVRNPQLSDRCAARGRQVGDPAPPAAQYRADAGTSPNALAGASTCREFEPAPTSAVRASGSIDTRASSRVTTRIVPAPSAAAVCPVACTATRPRCGPPDRPRQPRRRRRRRRRQRSLVRARLPRHGRSRRPGSAGRPGSPRHRGCWRPGPPRDRRRSRKVRSSSRSPVERFWALVADRKRLNGH